MSQSLPDILARFRALTRQLEDPEVAGNSAKLREVLKERGRLEGRAVKYEAWLQKRKEILETEALLDDDEMKEMAEEELLALRPDLVALTEELADEMGSDEADAANSVIIEIRPGTGGDEAALFAQNLY